MITAAIVAALVAVTLLVFAGGGGGGGETTTAPANPAGQEAACEAATGTGCVEAAKDVVETYSAPQPGEPAPSPVP